MIKITSLNKIYKSKKRKRCFALNDINLTLPDTGLVFALSLISLVIPMIKIKAIKPVKIIKAKE